MSASPGSLHAWIIWRNWAEEAQVMRPPMAMQVEMAMRERVPSPELLSVVPRFLAAKRSSPLIAQSALTSAVSCAACSLVSPEFLDFAGTVYLIRAAWIAAAQLL